jgi:glycolate oxidase FAD binding subunit
LLIADLTASVDFQRADFRCRGQLTGKSSIDDRQLVEGVLSGRGSVRSADTSDAIEGVQPRAIVEPDSPEALADLLAWSSRERLSLVIRGNGTKLAWGRRPAPIDLVVGIRRLNRVLAHPHGDLTATVQAGATVAATNRELARHGQWLPLDTSFEEATIGGTIATSDSGPLRHRHGTPRDLLIGVRLATTDGRLIKAGGNVVKNVAGYDLGKLISGSSGSLAAIVSATFKLAPLPSSSATLVATFRDPRQMAHAVSAIGSSQLEPAAFDLRAGTSMPCKLLIQFATTATAVDAQIEGARTRLSADEIEVLSGAGESELWRDHGRSLWDADGAVIRLSWLSAGLDAVLSLVADIGRDGARSVELAGRAGVGAGLMRVEGDVHTTVRAIERLREPSDVVGHVVVLRADAAVKERSDVWGPPGDAGMLLGAIKRALDPAAILNAGRGPL